MISTEKNHTRKPKNWKKLQVESNAFEVRRKSK